MRNLEVIFGDLAAADDPVEWACDNLKLIGRGSSAYIFEHPLDTRYVVRISDYPDGWFSYGESTMMLAEGGESVHHRPQVEAITVISGTFVGISERLDQIDDGTPHAEAVEAVISAMRVGEGWADVDAIIPGFSGFVTGMGKHFDSRPENFMRRGDVLVFNDPSAALSFDDERRIRVQYAFDGGDDAIRRPVRPCQP